MGGRQGKSVIDGIAMLRLFSKIHFEMSSIPEILTAAVANGSLLESAKNHISALLRGTSSVIAAQAIEELVTAGAWEELNDRFFKTEFLFELPF